jgi:hypothetical protein
MDFICSRYTNTLQEYNYPYVTIAGVNWCLYPVISSSNIAHAVNHEIMVAMWGSRDMSSVAKAEQDLKDNPGLQIRSWQPTGNAMWERGEWPCPKGLRMPTRQECRDLYNSG